MQEQCFTWRHRRLVVNFNEPIRFIKLNEVMASQIYCLWLFCTIKTKWLSGQHASVYIVNSIQSRRSVNICSRLCFELQNHTERDMSNRISEENLERLRKMKVENLKKLRIVEKLRTFMFVRKGSPAFHTRSYKIKIIYESVDDIPSHLKFEWKKHIARQMYNNIVKNKGASLVTKLS